jgi:uncharacterized protein (DUF927 family)
MGKYTLTIEANGRGNKVNVRLADAATNDTLLADHTDLRGIKDREDYVERSKPKLRQLGINPKWFARRIEAGWNQEYDRLRALKDEKEARQAKKQAAPTDLPEGCLWADVETPDGYVITKDGWVIQPSLEGDDKVLTTTAVWVEALVRDHRSDNWATLVVWLDRDERLHRCPYAAGRFHDQANTLIAELAEGGLAVVPGEEKTLLRYLAAYRVRRRVLRAERLGWMDGLPESQPPVFVLPDRTLGQPPGDDDEEVLYMPTGYAVTVNAFGVRGTLTDWQERVALKAKNNPVLIASLCIGFAGPLLKFAGVEGGGFHLHSATSRGKTTAAQCGASIWGNGTDPAEAPEIAFVKKWNATFNSMEGLAAERCDSLLTLDEIGEASAGDFGRTIYQLAGGQGKARCNRDGTLRAARSWRNTLLSTGEVPVEQHIESAGKKVRGGQLVRMVDIAGNGVDGIIQDAHGREPAEFVRQLKRACAQYYGSAGPAFVEALCQEGSAAELGKAIRRELVEAEEELTPKGAPAEVGRVVRRFALLLVAGRRACQAGVLPLQGEEILKAVRQVLQRWLDVHGSGVLERAVEQLRAFLLKHESRFRNKSDASNPPRDLVGYRDHVNSLYLLTQEGAKEALEGFSVPDVMRYLADNDYLFKNAKHRLLSNHRITGLNSLVRLYAVKSSLLGPPESTTKEIPRGNGTNGRKSPAPVEKGGPEPGGKG